MLIIATSIAILLIVVGILGSVLPILPGPQVGYIGILIFHFMTGRPFSTPFLIGWLIIMIILILLDQLLPMRSTKKFGGSKYGSWGSVVGGVLGMFGGVTGVLL